MMAFGAPFPGGVLVQRAFLAGASAVAVEPPRTFSGLAFGVEAPDRTLVAAIAGGATGQTVTAVTIGGMAATQIAGPANNGFSHASIWVALVPTGTSGAVTISATGASWDFALGLYGMTGNGLLTPAAAATGTSAASLTVAGGSVVIAAAFSNPGSLPAAWNGLTDDVDLSLVNPKASMASAQIQSAQILSVGVAMGGSQALAVAAWGP
jgi:hypothetical protein